ncbi:MAG: hypothetical protein ACRDK7_00060 [Solirubrobacteraceae bacterium]
MIPVATASPVLVFLALLGTCVWVGGLVAIMVVARVARHTLEPPVRVAFFRSLGRGYAVVGNAALVVAFACGAALLRGHRWDATALAAVVLAGVLVLATVAGMAQARGMTRLRRRAIREPADAVLAAQVHRGAVRATAIRATIGALSLALLALVAALVT